MSGEKVRVYDLAKQLNLPNKEVIALLEDKLKVTVKSHSSSIEKEQADKLVSLLKAPTVKKQPVVTKEPPAAKAPAVKIQKEETAKEIKQPEVKKSEPVAEVKKPEFKKAEAPVQEKRFQPTTNAGNSERKFPPRDNRFEKRPFQQRPGGFSSPHPRRDEDRNVYRNPAYDRPFKPAGQSQGAPPSRPPGQGGDGPRPPRPNSDRIFYNNPAFPGAKPFSPGARRPGAPAAPAPVDSGKTPGRKEVFGKKKDSKYKDKQSKEEKIEEIKLFQDKFKKKKKQSEEIKEKVTSVYIPRPLTVGELSEKLDINVVDVIKELFSVGILATVNQTIDANAAKEAAKKLGFTIIEKDETKEEKKKEETFFEEDVDETKLKTRAPVVTIMGHVDHGKTTLLDTIRSIKHKIVNTEVGGITQSIGAYTARVKNKKIVFIDTPGHEAFTAMRARGAQTTDIVVLVVAADDGIMPQTIEAISHAKAAKVPIIIAVNKIDKEGADADRVLQQLTEYDLVPEKWGGDTVCVPVSALKGTNIDELLEMIILVADLEDLKADPTRKASGVVIEAKLDKGKGALATLLVRTGVLKVGDFIICGTIGGKVKSMTSDEGLKLKQAGPSTPVEISGFTDVPQAGDKFDVIENDKTLKTMVAERKEKEKNIRFDTIASAQVRQDNIASEGEGPRDLNIIIKANTHGSAEAVSSSLQQLVSKEVFVKIVHIGIGDISEADIMLASASNAIVLGFAVKEDQNAQRLAASLGVDIRKYDIIYQIIEDIEKTMLGLLQPELHEIELGKAEIRQIFPIGKTQKIAGCYVLEGKILRNKEAILLRNGKEIYKGSIDQLKRFKDDVKEVASGYECGISLSKFNDIQEGDIIKVMTTKEVERETLV